MAPFVLALVLAIPPSPGEDHILEAAVKLSIPKKKSSRTGGADDEVLFRIWIPETDKPLRGAVVNPFYLKAVGQAHWRAFCEHHRFALVASNFFGVKQQDFPKLLDAMKVFAEKSGRPEIAGLPFCFVGMSAGAGMSVSLARHLSERTIAVGPVCLEVGPKSEPSRVVPIMTVFGSRDGKQMEKLEAKLPGERSAGARWAIAPMWGVRHEFSYANTLVMPFFDQVIRRRLPREGTALAEIDESEGWVGGKWAKIAPAAEFEGNKGETCWFPNRYVASVWRAFVQEKPALRITDPVSVKDKRPFTTYPAGEPLEVRIQGKGSVELYDGDVRIAGAEAPCTLVYEKPSAGIHALWAVGRDDQGRATYARPCTIIVK